MHLLTLIAGAAFLSGACHVMAAAPTAGSPAAGSPAAAASGGGNAMTGMGTSAAMGSKAGATTGTGTASGKGLANGGRAELLCGGFLGSGFLGNVLTVAPMAPSRSSDPNTAIQFSQIWSDSHQATVGGRPAAPTPHAKTVVAVVKLPIAFSADDRQKFEQAGWKLRDDRGNHGTAYCLENADRTDGVTPSPTRGMFCVSGGSK